MQGRQSGVCNKFTIQTRYLPRSIGPNSPDKQAVQQCEQTFTGICFHDNSSLLSLCGGLYPLYLQYTSKAPVISLTKP